jgi:hypothetical protein
LGLTENMYLINPIVPHHGTEIISSDCWNIITYLEHYYILGTLLLLNTNNIGVIKYIDQNDKKDISSKMIKEYHRPRRH